MLHERIIQSESTLAAIACAYPEIYLPRRDPRGLGTQGCRALLLAGSHLLGSSTSRANGAIARSGVVPVQFHPEPNTRQMTISYVTFKLPRSRQPGTQSLVRHTPESGRSTCYPSRPVVTSVQKLLSAH